MNRGSNLSGITKIGDNTLCMAYVHVGHDCNVGNNVILTNCVQLGGGVDIQNNAIIGGNTPVHQFCKIGENAFVGGGYRVVQDVPPYIRAAGEPLRYTGINAVGLRRKGFSVEIRTLIKKVYQIIYHSELNHSQAVNKIKNEYELTTEVKTILDFIENSERGLI